MKLIVGLGNPGRKYEATRHNAGFIALDLIADKFNIDIDKEKMKALVGEGNIRGEKVILVKPQTFMNLSGEAVGAVARWYKIEPEDILVIYDDMDLDLGRIRIRKKGSAGGHNGIKSLIQHLGTEEFPRIKIGIGRPAEKGTIDYVLGVFPQGDIPELEKALDLTVNALEDIMKNDIDAAMRNYN